MTKARATRQGDVPIPGTRQVRALFEGQVYDLPDDIIEEADWLVPLPPAGGKSAGSDAVPDGTPEPETEQEEEQPKPRQRRRRTPKGG